MTFGVDASARGEEFDYDRVFAGADNALIQAKQTGVDRVLAVS
jgi:PleD family two-component response regulator